MMYRGVSGTGTPLIELDEPPATGPIVGYSHQAIANLYTYARNNPINLVDPSGLDPEFMTREWFQWFARWDIPSYPNRRCRGGSSRSSWIEKGRSTDPLYMSAISLGISRIISASADSFVGIAGVTSFVKRST